MITRYKNPDLSFLGETQIDSYRILKTWFLGRKKISAENSSFSSSFQFLGAHICHSKQLVSTALHEIAVLFQKRRQTAIHICKCRIQIGNLATIAVLGKFTIRNCLQLILWHILIKTQTWNWFVCFKSQKDVNDVSATATLGCHFALHFEVGKHFNANQLKFRLKCWKQGLVASANAVQAVQAHNREKGIGTLQTSVFFWNWNGQYC